MNRALTALLAGLVASTTSFSAHAWGGQGHRLVAAIGQHQLDPGPRARIQALLALEGKQSMTEIATWADHLRATDPDLGKRSAGWHYVNIAEDDCQYTATRHCKGDDCVVEQIRVQGQLLADTTLSPAQRLQALKFVVHFVGDVHQPMHAGHGHDKGGNEHQLQLDGHGTNLHSLWDSVMLDSSDRNDQAYLAHLLQLPEQPLLPSNPVAWAEYSCRLAVTEGVYPPKGNLDPAYITTHLPLAEAQLLAGGRQLGILLNQLLAD